MPLHDNGDVRMMIEIIRFSILFGLSQICLDASHHSFLFLPDLGGNKIRRSSESSDDGVKQARTITISYR